MKHRVNAVAAAAVALVLVSFSPASARAADDDHDRATDTSAKTRDVSLTTDPSRPLGGMAVLQGEARLGARRILPGTSSMDIGASLFVGAGQLRQKDGKGLAVWSTCGDAVLECERATALWTGAQLVIYPVGTFDHGMQLGVEASYLHTFVTTSEGQIGRMVSQRLGAPPPADRTSSEGALMGAALVGYKLVTRSGFTVNPQVAAGPLVTKDGVSLAPRLALNVGWSF